MRFFLINKKNQQHHGKKDIALILGISALSAVSALLMLLIPNKTGNILRITTDQKLYGEYNLLENQVITIKQPLGYNQIIIKDGAAYMESADCPDKYCMDYQPISKGNEVIICLPHKLVIEVVGETEKEQLDAIAARERELTEPWQKRLLTARCFLHWQWYLDI